MWKILSVPFGSALYKFHCITNKNTVNGLKLWSQQTKMLNIKHNILLHTMQFLGFLLHLIFLSTAVVGLFPKLITAGGLERIYVSASGQDVKLILV
jgi:hypothetical protein